MKNGMSSFLFFFFICNGLISFDIKSQAARLKKEYIYILDLMAKK